LRPFNPGWSADINIFYAGLFRPKLKKIPYNMMEGQEKGGTIECRDWHEFCII
jgi:hypothetical protein